MENTELETAQPATDAPNYQRGLTDDICVTCAFGQLFPHCNLYDFKYSNSKDFVCDRFRYYEVLELEPPHGFLMTNGKQTALASIETRDITKPALIVSNGEAFGIAEFEQPAQVGVKEFDSDEWQSQHRITQRERRQWWPEEKSFYVYRLKNWWPYEGVTLYEDGRVINEPKLSSRQWQIVSKSKDLPKQIILDSAAVAITDKHEFIICDGAGCDQLKDVLAATYETDVKAAKSADEIIPIYSLALVRNPRMRVSKKNTIQAEETAAEKQEDENMPYRIVEREDEYCVVKINADDTDGEIEGCHGTEDEAAAQLAALRINVEAEEGEAAAHDKPKKKPQHPKKKQLFGLNEESIEQQLNFIRRQFEDEFNESDSQISQSSSPFIWISDIFDSFLIVEDEGRLFRVGYVETDEDIVFTPKAAWIEVERGYAPKGFKLLEHKEKEIKPGQPNFLERLKLAAKNIIDIIKLAETGGSETKLFIDDVGIGQKLVDGELWHFTWSTNAFKDRDGEIFSTKSLEDYVTANENKESKGFFNFWHINEEDGNFNTDFAIKQWQGVVGRFLVEAGPYLKDEKGRAARKFYKKYPDGHPEIAPEGWGCSPEYKYLPEERVTGIYKNIWITRTSTLPKMAAANIWTDTRQANMNRGMNTMALTDQQRKAAAEMFGEDFVASMIDDAQSKTTELEAAGVAHKSAEETETETETIQDEQVETEEGQPEPAAEITMSQDQFDTLAEAVAGRFQVDTESIVGAMGAIAENLREMGGRVAELESKGKAQDEAEMPRYTFELQRASQDELTTVTDDDDLKNKKPAETKGATQTQATVTPDSFFTKA